MRVLVVGNGAREHALCWALSRDASVERIYAAPGNAGMAEIATLEKISAADIPGLVEFAERESIDLTVVGPEAPLVAGLVDEMQARGLRAFGPTRDGARIEGSKAWARRLCDDHGIPGPRAGEFDAVDPAMAFVETLDAPFVVKVDGLAAGKGVTIAEDRASAERALQDSLVRKVFGDSGARVVVEEFLEGEEVTALGLTDGSAVIPLALAQDYKRALDGDRGPNTGGMGAYSPLPFVVPGERKEQIEGVLRATVAAMASMGIEYRGVLYAGLMLTDRGARVLEFNCRFGDPETQAILPRLTSNLTELLLACVEGNLADCTAEWTAQACVAVVLASHGYPGDYPTGVPIEGLDRVRDRDGVQAFHAGTAVRDGRVVTSGGRVVTISALGEGLDDARRRAYEACGLIEFEGKTLRGDVAQRIQGAA